MSNIEDEATVIEMAATVEDRTRGEHNALLRRARQVDARRNALTITNPRAATLRRCDFSGQPIGNTVPLEAIPRIEGPLNRKAHPRSCPCTGYGWVPSVGLSRLADLVAEGEPS